MQENKGTEKHKEGKAHPISLKRSCLFGVAGSIIALSSIMIAISISPWFSWEKNALSDLGVSDAAPIFNIGLILAGILYALFSLGLLIHNPIHNKLSRIGVILFFIAAIALMGIGIFTEDYGRLHFQFSVAFFVIMISAILVFGISIVRIKSMELLGWMAFIVGVIGIIVWAQPNWDGVAIPETISAFPVAVWVILFGIKLSIFKEKEGD